MTRYDVVLLDADRTLLDFERSEREALRRVLKKWGLPQDDPVYGDYSKINDALWAAFARGKIDQDFLVVERFAALLRLYGAPDSPDPARLNRDFSAAWGGGLLPGAERDGADPGHCYQRLTRSPAGPVCPYRAGQAGAQPVHFHGAGGAEAPGGVF